MYRDVVKCSNQCNPFISFPGASACPLHTADQRSWSLACHLMCQRTACWMRSSHLGCWIKTLGGGENHSAPKRSLRLWLGTSSLYVLSMDEHGIIWHPWVSCTSLHTLASSPVHSPWRGKRPWGRRSCKAPSSSHRDHAQWSSLHCS